MSKDKIRVVVSGVKEGGHWSGYETCEVFINGQVEAFIAYNSEMLPDHVTLKGWGRTTATQVHNELYPKNEIGSLTVEGANETYSEGVDE